MCFCINDSTAVVLYSYKLVVDLWWPFHICYLMFHFSCICFLLPLWRHKQQEVPQALFCRFISMFSCSLSGRLLASYTEVKRIYLPLKCNTTSASIIWKMIAYSLVLVQQTLQHFPFINLSTNVTRLHTVSHTAQKSVFIHFRPISRTARWKLCWKHSPRVPIKHNYHGPL